MSDTKDESKEEKPPSENSPPAQSQEPAASPKVILQELEKTAALQEDKPIDEPKVVVADQSAKSVTDTPLITQAMRSLDELLARFRK